MEGIKSVQFIHEKCVYKGVDPKNDSNRKKKKYEIMNRFIYDLSNYARLVFRINFRAISTLQIDIWRLPADLFPAYYFTSCGMTRSC